MFIFFLPYFSLFRSLFLTPVLALSSFIAVFLFLSFLFCFFNYFLLRISYFSFLFLFLFPVIFLSRFRYLFAFISSLFLSLFCFYFIPLVSLPFPSVFFLSCFPFTSSFLVLCTFLVFSFFILLSFVFLFILILCLKLSDTNFIAKQF